MITRIEPINKDSDKYTLKLIEFESIFRLPIREKYGKKYRVESISKPDTDGYQITLYSYMAQGKVVRQFEERYNKETKTLILEKV